MPETFLTELGAVSPKLLEAFRLPYARFVEAFGRWTPCSVDRGVMQKTKKAVLIKLPIRWLDLVSWDNYLEAFAAGKGNYKIGKAKFLDSKNCFTYSRGRLICVVGLKDVMAVDSADSLLLVKRGSSDKVKDLVESLNREGYSHNKDGLTVYRPWGYYTILHEGRDYKVKEIGIYPGRSLSLQKHRRRSEHWNVVEGQVSVLVDGVDKKAAKNESVFVPRGAKHRIYNPTRSTAKIIEVQIGKYLGEDDIVRFSQYE